MVFLLFVCPLLSEEPEGEEDLFLEHAGRMNRHMEGERIVLYLFEDVQWKRGETVISSDTACYREDEGWLQLTGNVIVSEPERTIYSDLVDYFEEGDSAVATGDVIVLSDDNKQEMRTDLLIYRREIKRMTAFNRPVITVRREDEDGDSTSMAIIGDHVVSSGEDSLFVVGDCLVKGDSLHAECDSAYYDLVGDWIRLRQGPVVSVNDYTAWGDEIDLFVPDEQLERAIARGNARAEGKKKLEEDGEITGEERYWSDADSLLLYFEDEELRAMSAFSHARSLIERESEGKKVEKNYVTGDAILVSIEDGKVEKVTVEGDGKGVYVIPPDTTHTGKIRDER